VLTSNIQEGFPSLHRADIATFADAVDSLKKENRGVLSNVFLSISELADIFVKKECFISAFEETIIVLIPYHDKYFDLLFYTSTKEHLKNAMDIFTRVIYKHDFPVRISVIGVEPLTGEIASLLENFSFELSKKIGRVNFTSSKNEAAEDFFSSFGKDKRKGGVKVSPSFADLDDAQAVLDMLLEEFDLCSENIPELDAIRENIRKKNVVVAKKHGEIIAICYFTIKNRIRFCIYEYTRKEYRGAGVMFYLNNFVEKYFKKNNIKLARSYGWRDVNKKRLIKIYRALGENFDGVYIYNLIFNK